VAASGGKGNWANTAEKRERERERERGVLGWMGFCVWAESQTLRERKRVTESVGSIKLKS